MISLIKLHFSYSYSWKTIYIILIIFGISILSFVFLSNFYLDHSTLIFNREYYQDEYVYSSLTLIKIFILLQAMYTVINGFVINKYDVYLVIRRNRTSVISSKVISMVIGIMVFTTILYVLMNIIGLFLTPYFIFTRDYIDLFFDLIIFSVLYTLLNTILIIIVKNMYSLLLVFILYFISNISIEYLVIKSELSVFSKMLNLIFTDVGFYKEIGYDLFYSNLYYLSLCIVLFEVILVIYNKSDILN